MHGHPRLSAGCFLWLPFLLLALPQVVSGNERDTVEERMSGTAVTAVVPHARESFDDLRRLAPFRLPQDGTRQAIPFRRTPRPTVPAAPASAAPEIVLPADTDFYPAPRASAISGSFPGLQNFPLAGDRDVIPPDTMGAAGPTHLVSILNSEFGIFDKSAGLLPSSKVTLQEFWASLGTDPGQPADFPFDPKILYDQHSGRFVAVTLDCTVAPHSWVLIAISSSADPTGAWYKWAIDADLDNGVQQFFNVADYPGLGVDVSNIYVTANMYSNGNVAQYSKVWVIPKAQLLSGSNPITWYEFRDPPSSDFSMQPAHSIGTTAAEYLLFEGDGSNLRLARIDNTTGIPVWNAPATVTVSRYTSSAVLAGAPQLNSAGRIDTADTRVLNVVYRNGNVWATHHVPVTSADGKTEVAWYRIDPSTKTTVKQGRISDPNRWYYYPSIAVNQDNVAALGFSGSSTEEYASAFYTVVWPSTGAADPVTLLKRGDAPYDKTLGGTSIRWGDFSATSVDPTDNTTFWTLQEYAASPHQGTPMWGTWWGKISPGEPPPPSSSGGGGGSCDTAGVPPAVAGDGLSLGWLPLLLIPTLLYVRRRMVRAHKVP